MNKERWGELLSQWVYLIQPKLAELREFAIGYGIISDDSVSSVHTNGCSPEEIRKLEERLGVKLPASYSEFLLQSNGAYLFECTMNLLPSTEVDWLRNIDPDTIKIWNEDPAEVNDEDYFVYGADQDCVNFRPEYLNDCLVVSTTIDGDVFLLNSKIQTAEGEWEAWFFGPTNPGADRYRSFWELMLQRFSYVEDYLEQI